MLRFLIFVLGILLGITLLRSVVGILLKAITTSLQPTPTPEQRAQQQVPLSGELKRDPVCGTYVSTVSSIKQTVRGEEVHFCSAGCRDKYRPA